MGAAGRREGSQWGWTPGESGVSHAFGNAVPAVTPRKTPGGTQASTLRTSPCSKRPGGAPRGGAERSGGLELSAVSNQLGAWKL